MKNLLLPVFVVIFGLAVSCGASQKKSDDDHQHKTQSAASGTYQSVDTIKVGNVDKTEDEWKQILSKEEYQILRARGTEPAFQNEYYDNKKEGIYYCAACGLPLYSSETKFHSGTGWPSCWAPIDSKLVERKTDTRFSMERTEVVCAQCGSHLGHIFANNTVPSGERHCLNSLALDFKAK